MYSILSIQVFSSIHSWSVLYIIYLLSFVETPRKKLNKYFVFTMQTYKKLITVYIICARSFFVCYHRQHYRPMGHWQVVLYQCMMNIDFYSVGVPMSFDWRWKYRRRCIKTCQRICYFWWRIWIIYTASQNGEMSSSRIKWQGSCYLFRCGNDYHILFYHFILYCRCVIHF